MSTSPDPVDDLDADVPDPGEYGVRALRDELQAVESLDVLDAMYAAEHAGDDRKTAKRAIASRRKALEPDDDGEADGLSGDGDGADVSDSGTTQRDGTQAAPTSAADSETVVVRNINNDTLQLRGLKGSIAPGETKVYPVSDRLRQYINEGKLQVIRSG